jgi:hypothetical protein
VQAVTDIRAIANTTPIAGAVPAGTRLVLRTAVPPAAVSLWSGLVVMNKFSKSFKYFGTGLRPTEAPPGGAKIGNEHVRIEIRDGIALVQMAKPPVNAIDIPFGPRDRRWPYRGARV